jgi:pimeloyl-ACP methyl ester carboxylesterase
MTRKFLARRLAGEGKGQPATLRALRNHRRRLDRFSLHLTRETILARFALAANLHRKEAHLRSVLERWQGAMLLILAEDDPLFGSRQRARMRAVFPHAQIHTFAIGGHVIPLFHGDEVRRLVGLFAADDQGNESATA